MKTTTTLVLLPYFANIALKVSSLLVDRTVALRALEDLAALPKPPKTDMNLTRDQREIIVAHISHANLKSTTILTATASFFLAAILVIENQGSALALAMFFLFGLCLFWWILPKKPHYFASNKRAQVATLLFCIYDVALGYLAIASVSAGPKHS